MLFSGRPLGAPGTNGGNNGGFWSSLNEIFQLVKYETKLRQFFPAVFLGHKNPHKMFDQKTTS